MRYSTVVVVLGKEAQEGHGQGLIGMEHAAVCADGLLALWNRVQEHFRVESRGHGILGVHRE